MRAVPRSIDKRDYRDLTRIGSLELKSRKRSSLAVMMELRQLTLVACLARRFLRAGAAAARGRISPEVWDGPLPDVTPGSATPWDCVRSYAHDRGSFDTE